ncbi:MAG TPA: protein kinase [Polyangium sp.]|nr:protein kinase [Polyangium sp.]
MGSEAAFAGRYLLERRAGAGGMGEVWKALDQETGAAVAVKLLPSHDPEDAARFTREARILAGLSHPLVVRHVAHGASAEGTPYLVMEWLDGEDLAARLSRGPLAVDESVALALQVADVLAFAHAQGVIHRDLKPGNVFLPEGRLSPVKVLDFGIAHASHATRMTRTGMLIGTPGYMAPEQARGEASIDARADVFSLGCVLFECLTGEPAFGGQHVAAILTKVLFEETPSVRRARPEVPEALDALLRRMLAKQREERPFDGQTAATELRALEDLPSQRPGGSVRAPSLTGSEQRPMAVLLVSAPAKAEVKSLDGDSTLALIHDDTALLREAEQHGGAGERLLDGSLVVLMAGADLATDLCAQAARCALALHAHAGERRVALAMGRGERTVRSLGPAIDRVVRLSRTTGREAALEGAVVIDEVVAGLLDARFEVQEGEGFFTLHGERALAEGTRLLLGKATPCVGRERELGMLRGLFTESVEESVALAVLVVAPPGVGKSRLAHELLQEIKARGEAVSIWVARGDALRAGSPLGMFGQVLRSACGIREGELLPVRREKLAAQVAAWLPPNEQRRVAEFLGEIIGAPFPDEESVPLRSARLDAQLMADQVRAAFLDFVGGACEKAPVLVLLEDLHWGDTTTVQLLDAALRKLEERPLFVLALARPEVHAVFPKLWTERRSHELRLVKLSRSASERLARHVLGERADTEMVARIVRLSEGNAFYLEELIRWTAEGKGADMPETVVAMVESRLSALDEGARRLLRAASVFGEVFWAGGVAALLGGEARRSGVMRGLAPLVERELLVQRRESRFAGEEELAFRHALLREGAYAMLTEGDRMLGHRLAGAWLEARGETDARALAEHFEKGGDGPAAGRHYLRASQQALWGGSAHEAGALARRGLALPLPGELRVRLLGTLCETSIWQPDVAASMQHEAKELMAAAPRGSALWVQGVAARLSGAAVAGMAGEILAIACELEQADAAPDAVYLMAITLALAIHSVGLAGGSPLANTMHAKLEAMAEGGGDQNAAAMCLVSLSKADREANKENALGQLVHARKSREFAKQCGHRRMEIVATLTMATSTWCLGAMDEAEQLLGVLSLSDDEFGFASSHRPFMLAWMLADRGALDDARACAERLVSLGRARGLPLDEGRGRWVLAEVRRRMGALEEADADVETALRLLGGVCPADVSGVLATKAALKLSNGQPGEALAAAEEGLSRRAAIVLHDDFFRGAFLRLVHIESLEACGRHEEARAALVRAWDRLLAIAAKIDEPAYRASFLENVPENRRTLELVREWIENASRG